MMEQRVVFFLLIGFMKDKRKDRNVLSGILFPRFVALERFQTIRLVRGSKQKI